MRVSLWLPTWKYYGYGSDTRRQPSGGAEQLQCRADQCLGPCAGHRWGSDGEISDGLAITLAKTFAPGTTANEVKIGGEAEIDTVQAWLAALESPCW
jgi:hypothetical protein